MYLKRQKHIKVIFVAVIIFLLGLIKYPVFAREPGKRVLILNSYHGDFTWTGDITKSILEELRGSGLNLLTYTEYMDWKNFPIDKNIENLHATYKTKYQNKGISLIITTDDKALEFALKHREELFSNAPIVFAGVNEEGERRLIKDERNITGVIEYIDLKEIIDMALGINPDMKELYIVHDQTESAKSEYYLVENIIKSKYHWITPKNITNRTHKGIIENIRGLDEGNAVLILTYYQDILGRAMDFEEFTEAVSKKSNVPVFHIYSMVMGHGSVGGAMISPTLHGKNAGKIAVRILKGEKADEISIIRDTPLKLMFDYEQLERFNIPIKSIPEGAEIINEPFSFFKTYKLLVILWSVILSLLVILVIALTIYNSIVGKIRKRLQRQLQEVSSMQEKLRKMAYYDALTGMRNKRALQEELEIYIDNCKGRKGAVIFIDADNFKLINDTLGHSVGDKFIIEIGKRLQNIIDNNVKVYRMGGDEFIILITNVVVKNDITKIADKIMDFFEKEFLIEDMAIHTTVSAGITVYPEHGETSEALIMGADIAMYEAKSAGKGKYLFYNDEMNKEVIERASIEVNLRGAMEKQEFLLYYQPQYNLQNRKIVGFEALIRWNNKELGWVPPFKFIQIAENSRMIIPMGKWILQAACRFIKQVHELGYPDYTIAVNISMLQVMQEDFVDMVMDILKENNLDPKYLEIEMTETMLIENIKVVADKLTILRNNGVKVALDDFGTGYSSLNYLNNIPIDTLKIDKSFIDTITKEGEERTIINILIELSHRLGLTIIAEGVETEQEFEYLRKSGCDHMQGYLLSRPLPESEIIDLLRV